MVPPQVSPGLPRGWSAVTGVPAGNSQGMDTGRLPPTGGKGTVFATARVMTVLTGSRFWTVYEHVNEAPGGSKEGQVLVIARPVVTLGIGTFVPAALVLAPRVTVVRELVLG